jgi:protein TonB
MRSQDRSPVAEEEEPYVTSDSIDSSPAKSYSSPKLPRPPVNFVAIMLDNGEMKRPRRALNVLVSFVGHALFFGIIILIPLLYTHTLDLSGFQSTFLVAPPPPPPAPPASIAPRHPLFHLRQAKLYAPRVIPKQIANVKDQPQASQPAPPGLLGGVPGGVPGGQLGGVLGGILGPGGHQIPPPPPPSKAPVHRGPYRVGGKVQAPRLIREVKPIYPVLAKDARISGRVAIDCVIDEHGDVTQMQVVSGEPLLVTAALNAVEQWKYQPTLLNGKPIPVDMIVTVTFTLGS